MYKTRRLTSDEITTVFVDDADVVSATRSWAQGHLSDQEFIDQLKSTKENINSRDIRVESDDADIWESA